MPRRGLTSLHHWAGLLLAGWLVVATTTGALLLFKDEYYGWRYPTLPDSGDLIAPDAGVVDSILSNASQTITLLGPPTPTLPAYHAWYADGSEALYHPETGQLVDRWTVLDALPAFLFELHVHLLLGETGHTIVGIVGLVAALNILLGIVLWFGRRQVLRLRHALPRGVDKKYLIRGHAAQGAILGPLLIVLLLSGVSVVFYDAALSGLRGVFGGSDRLKPTITTVSPAASRTDWKATLDAASSEFPNARLRYLTPPSAPDKPLIIRVRNSGELHPNGRSYVVLHPETGEVLESIDATQTGTGPAILNALYPIHAGKTGWPGYRLLLTVTALSLLYLSASGAYLFIRRPRPRKAAP